MARSAEMKAGLGEQLDFVLAGYFEFTGIESGSYCGEGLMAGLAARSKIALERWHSNPSALLQDMHHVIDSAAHSGTRIPLAGRLSANQRFLPRTMFAHNAYALTAEMTFPKTRRSCYEY